MALAQESPDFAEIRDVQLQGSGCHDAEVAVSFSPDFKDLSLLFDNYLAEIGEGSLNPRLLQLRKDCQISLEMTVPQGWQMAFRAVDYRGFALLPYQATGFQRFSILQEGAPIVSMKEASLRGPLNEDYYIRSEVRPERLTWSSCLNGRTEVKLMTQIGVNLNPRSSDRSLTMITLDSADTSIQQNLTVEWRRCANHRQPPITQPGRPERPPREEVRPVRPPPPENGARPGNPGRPRNPVRPPQYSGR